MFSARDKGINKKVKLISFQLVIRINVSNYFNIILSRLVGMIQPYYCEEKLDAGHPQG